MHLQSEPSRLAQLLYQDTQQISFFRPNPDKPNNQTPARPLPPLSFRDQLLQQIESNTARRRFDRTLRLKEERAHLIHSSINVPSSSTRKREYLGLRGSRVARLDVLKGGQASFKLGQPRLNGGLLSFKPGQLDFKAGQQRSTPIERLRPTELRQRRSMTQQSEWEEVMSRRRDQLLKCSRLIQSLRERQQQLVTNLMRQ